MSAEAVAWVYRHSTATGATMVCHLAIADTVDDRRRFFMVLESLAVKARCHRGSAQRAVHWLVEQGYLELLSANSGGRSKAAHYAFLMPDVPVVWDSQNPRNLRDLADGETRAAGATTESKPAQATRKPAQAARRKELPGTTTTTAKPPAADGDGGGKATDDPVRRCAHRLAVLAMEQPEKPLIRDGGNPFPAVMGIVEKALRAGRVVGDLERAISGGYVEVWTAAGLATALAKSRVNGHARSPAGRGLREAAGSMGIELDQARGDLAASLFAGTNGHHPPPNTSRSLTSGATTTDPPETADHADDQRGSASPRGVVDPCLSDVPGRGRDD